MTPQRHRMLDALVQNYQFKKVKSGRLPTIDYVYSAVVEDGNSEAFRFDGRLRRQLSLRAQGVHESLTDKLVAYTTDENMLLEVGEIAPRLGLREQITGEVNSVYTYAPLLLVGVDVDAFEAYVVKPVVDASMAWFELSDAEREGVHGLLSHKAEEKPYRTLLQRIIG